MAVKAIVITGYGFNSDVELARAFDMAGASASRVHLSELLERPALVRDFDVLGFPGGFSFGDHLGSGKEIANLLRSHLKEELEAFIARGGPVIGICNGFQVLVKLGLVPNTGGNWEPEASLIHNESGAFMDRWTALSFEPDCPCVWTRGMEPMELPIRHGEGRFIAPDAVLDDLERKGLVALRYRGNPNGSMRDIAGITDPSGRVLGLMPHPECFLVPENHPRWQRERVTRTGLEIIRRGVEAAEGK